MEDRPKKYLKWVLDDIETAQEAASSETVSNQAQIIEDIILGVVADKFTGPVSQKLIEIIKAPLSGSYTLHSTYELFRLSEAILKKLSDDKCHSAFDGLVSTLALLFNRLPLSLTLNTHIEAAVKDLCNNSPNTLSQSLLNAIIKRIDSYRIRKNNRNVPERKNKISELNIGRAAKNVISDVEGDWYQDPWGWPEIGWLGEKGQHRVAERLKSSHRGWSVALDVPKRGGGIRPGILFEPTDRIVYQSLVDDFSVDATGNLPSWVHGWRVSRKDIKKGHYESNADEWKAFRERLKTLRNNYRYAAHIDVQSFFASINVPLVINQIGRRYRNFEVIDRLETFLEDIQDLPNGKGIPQRSLASSVISHVILRPLDAYLERATRSGTSKTIAASRWMDDIWLHGDSKKEILQAFREVEDILGQSGLSLNSNKSVISDTELDSDSEIYDPYDLTEQNSTLNQLVDENGDTPAFMIGWEATKMFRNKNYAAISKINEDRFLTILDLGSRLAPLFRESGEWKRFEESYMEFARRFISKENTAVTSWGEMFPDTNSKKDDLKLISAFFQEQLCDGTNRLLIPLAAQRVSRWHPGTFISEYLLDDWQDNNDLFQVRGTGFACMGSGIPKAVIAKILSDAGDDVTAEFIKKSDGSEFKLSSRFTS